MAKRLDAFPPETTPPPRRYPWADWTDGSAWEIRQGNDYDVKTENMRVNLHMKAEQTACKVRTKKIADDAGEGLVFQFYGSEENDMISAMEQAGRSEDVQHAMEQLYADAIEIYERARAEVTIPRRDGTRQKYAANRYKQQIDKGREDNSLVPTIARIVRKPTLGFGHLDAAGRSDLMLENLVLDSSKTYHRFFTKTTVETARERMAQYTA
jgi:hypothetical protein